MKKNIFLLLLNLQLLALPSISQSIWTNPITGTNPNTFNPYTAGQTVDPNITVSGIGRGSGINGSNTNDRYNATAWNSAGLDQNDYFTFTLTPNSGYKINFSSLVYTGQASGSGPVSFSFRSSLDNYSTNIGTPSATGTTISLNSAAYQNITGAVTFRLYGWGASSSAGSFSVNDFTFNGTTALSHPSSANADLADLSISPAILTPAFTSANLNYTASVANNVTTATVTPTAADAGAIIKVNGGLVASGSPVSVPLNVGHNTIFIIVTSQDGTTSKTYFIDVSRDASASSGNNWYVNDNSITGDHFTTAVGNDVTGTGSSSAPFITVSKAILAALPGDNIFVDAGAYNENVIVTKSIKIYGSNYAISPNGGSRFAEAIITAPAGTTPEATRVFDVYTPGTSVEIKGFKLINGRPLSDGHRIRTAANSITVLFEKNWVQHGDNLFCGTLTTWKNVTITDNFFDATDKTISSSAIQLNDAGVQPASVIATITDNVINGTTWAGILCDNIASANILRNNISNISGEAGIQLAGAMGTTTISQNEIINANGASPVSADDGGIKIYGSQFTGIVNVTNNIVRNVLNGFVVKNGGNIAGNIHVNNNSFDPVTRYTIYHGGSGTLDAMCNWHGSSTGAIVAAKIFTPATVTYISFLTISTDVSAAAGFQPDPNPSNCSGNNATPVALPENVKMELYPVPVKDIVNIKYQSSQKQQVSVLVIDEEGKIMQKENIVVIAGTNSIRLSVRKLYKGIYTVIINGRDQCRKKMIRM